MWLKIILGLSTVNILISSSHAAAANLNEFRDNCREKCYTDVCADEALRFIKLMDDTVDPCENFYDFVCGTYLRDKSPGETESAASIVMDLQNAVSTAAVVDLHEEIKDTDLNAFKKIKTYYQNCLNEEEIEQAGLLPLQRILNSVGGWPVRLGNRWNEQSYDLWQALYTIHDQKLPAFFPVVLATELDNLDSSKFAININNPTLNVNAAWFAGDDRNRVKKIFLEMLVNVATILGARNDSTTLREMQQVTDFEINLFNISTPDEKLVNLPVERMRTTISELSRKYPSIPWLEFINRILRPAGVSVNEGEYVYVTDPDSIEKLVRLIQRTPKRVLANFVAWRMVQNTIPYMPQVLTDAVTDYEVALEGPSATDRESTCYNKVQKFFTLGLSAMFIRNHMKDPVEKPIAEMFEIMKGVARKNLQENNWMDEPTRRLALEKLDAMGASIVASEELKDDRKVNEYYRELDINPGSFLESALNATFFTDRAGKKNLKKPVSEHFWASKPGVVEINGYNLYQRNSIELPAGFLTAFYKLGKPEFVNYGVAGAFIGHEVFHGFDSIGKQYDKHGNQVNWWTPEAEQKFKQKAQCIIDQYSNFTVPVVNMNVNGELSQSENIADNGGFRAGYLAYKEWLRRHSVTEGCLPSLNYTPQQMFWISSAAIWCSKETPEAIRSAMLTDNHSPNVARVMVTFSNIKEFSDDFKCKLGSKMNPRKKCQVW